MSAIILHLDNRTIKAAKMNRPTNPIKIDSGNYIHENFYFGDWIPLRNRTDQIVGMKIVPFAKDDYLEKWILSAKFVKLGKNVSVVKADKDT